MGFAYNEKGGKSPFQFKKITFQNSKTLKFVFQKNMKTIAEIMNQEIEANRSILTMIDPPISDEKITKIARDHKFYSKLKGSPFDRDSKMAIGNAAYDQIDKT